MSQCKWGNMIRNRSRDRLSRKKLHVREQAWTSEWWEKLQSVGSAGAWQFIGCLHSTSSIRIRTLSVLHSRLRSGKDSDSSLHCSGKELGICHSCFCYWVTSMLGNRLECCMHSWEVGILKGQTSLCSWLFLLFALWGLLTQLPSKQTETFLSYSLYPVAPPISLFCLAIDHSVLY